MGHSVLNKNIYGALAGASFLTVFITLVLLMGILHNFATVLDVYGLGNAVILALNSAKQQFGYRLGIMLFMLIIFDYLICMMGGILGFNLSQIKIQK